MKKTILLFLSFFLVAVTPPNNPTPPKKHKDKYKCAKQTIDWALNVAGYFTHGKKNKKRLHKWRNWILRKENEVYKGLASNAIGWISSKNSAARLSYKLQLFISARIFCGLPPLPEANDPPTYQ